MKKYFGKLLLSYLHLCTPGLIHAQEASIAEGYTFAMPFLSMDISPRNLAVGGTTSVMPSDAYAHFGNVAAVPFSGSFMNAGVAYCLKQPSRQTSNSIAAAASLKIGKRLGFTLGLLSDIGRAYNMMDENGVISGSYTPADITAGAGIAYRPADFVSLGATLNYAGSRLWGMSGQDGTSNVFFADIQILFKVRDFNFSLSAANLGTPVKSVSGLSYNLPMNGTVGAGYSVSFGEHNLSAGLEAGLFLGSSTSLFGSAGVEYMFMDIMALRVGYHYGSDISAVPSYASAGVGFHFKGFSIDAAYLFASKVLKNTFSVGLGYSF